MLLHCSGTKHRCTYHVGSFFVSFFYVLVTRHKPKQNWCRINRFDGRSTGNERQHLLCSVAVKIKVLRSIFSILPPVSKQQGVTLQTGVSATFTTRQMQMRTTCRKTCLSATIGLTTSCSPSCVLVTYGRLQSVLSPTHP